MKLLYKILRQDPESREGVVVTTSALGILVNLILAVASIAIVSEGVNNATDSAGALITSVGTKRVSDQPSHCRHDSHHRL